MSTATTSASAGTNGAKEMVYSLPDLPYDTSALQPIISAQIMELHHGKHHAAYVKSANATLDQLRELGADADPTSLLQALEFNVSGHVLHSLFWTSMTPQSSAPSASLSAAIEHAFGSLDVLKGRLVAAVSKLAGSGWGALLWEPTGQRLLVAQIHDHQSQTLVGAAPLLVIDGWEHAYYLDYHSDRATWAEKFFEVADWSSASVRFDAACLPTSARG